MELRISRTDPLVGDVGFLVAPQARGRGYASAALAALCGWGFTALGLARIEWRAYVGNDASRRVAEKAGFVFEGTARRAVSHRGQRVDAWVGALVREEDAA
jgi:RimJ/RimL family protein N-acetyltransferase